MRVTAIDLLAAAGSAASVATLREYVNLNSKRMHTSLLLLGAVSTPYPKMIELKALCDLNTVKADRLFYSTCAMTLGTAIGNLLAPYKTTTDTRKLALSAGMSHSALVTSYESAMKSMLRESRSAEEYAIVLRACGTTGLPGLFE